MLHEFRPGASVEDLRHAVGLTHSGAVRLVDRLVADGDVERRAADDARAVSLVLTPKGRRTATRIRATHAETVDRALGALTASDAPPSPVCRRRSCAKSCASASPSARKGIVPPDGWVCRLCDPAACRRAEGDCPAVEAATRR